MCEAHVITTTIQGHTCRITGVYSVHTLLRLVPGKIHHFFKQDKKKKETVSAQDRTEDLVRVKHT